MTRDTTDKPAKKPQDKEDISEEERAALVQIVRILRESRRRRLAAEQKTS